MLPTMRRYECGVAQLQVGCCPRNVIGEDIIVGRGDVLFYVPYGIVIILQSAYAAGVAPYFRFQIVAAAHVKAHGRGTGFDL